MLYKLTRSSPVCRDVTPLTFEAPFLLHPPSGRSLLRANRRRRRDAKPRGLASRDSPAAGGSNPAPRPEHESAGFFCPRERGFVSLASGSRAHDVGQAITPQGQLWGVCF